ncbi:MAG: hypothetical protein ACKKMV_03035 [Candidatus Nealsonbacteria bacterium]
METNKESKFNLHRRDSGYLRLIISALFLIVAGFAFWLGFQLIKIGATGSWKIVSEFKGWILYIASLSPGISFIFGGIAILIWALPKTLKNL